MFKDILMQKFLRLFSCVAILLALSISLGAFSCEEETIDDQKNASKLQTN